MVQGEIPQAKWPKAISDKDWDKDLIKALMECGNLKSFNWGEFDKRPLSTKVSYAFFEWQCEINEIIGNLNIAITDLRGLSRCVDMSASELWSRYRLLARLILYELYRVKEVTGSFFKNLKRLKLTDEKNRRDASNGIREILKPLIDVRNQITHKNMRVLEEERSAWFAVIAESANRLLLNNELRRVIEPYKVVGDIACRIANEFAEIGEPLFSFLQQLNDELAQRAVKALVDEDSTIPNGP